MDDDFWEILFILFADWRIVLALAIILTILSIFGVIPWGKWL